jgi:hypothetical protein
MLNFIVCMGGVSCKKVRKIKLPTWSFSTGHDRSATVTLGKRNMYSQFFFNKMVQHIGRVYVFSPYLLFILVYTRVCSYARSTVPVTSD